jgi:hypothetical protein
MAERIGWMWLFGWLLQKGKMSSNSRNSMTSQRTRYWSLLVMFVISSFVLFGLCDNGDASEPFTIGVIQYNVKGSHGGWRSGNGVLDAQVSLIANQIKSNPVDFVALEEADEKRGKPEPIISKQLTEKGLMGWNTVASVCDPDTTQLAFSSSWELMRALAIDSVSRQAGWTKCGQVTDGRPYNIVLLKNKKSALKVLFVVTHMPHCYGSAKNCADNWELPQFRRDLSDVLTAANGGAVNFIVTGDLNELAKKIDDFNASNKKIAKKIDFNPSDNKIDDQNVLSLFFGDFPNLQISPARHTCCSDSSWVHTFDRILASSSDIPRAEILGDSGYSLNEEHKAIYGTVVFSSIGPKSK